MRRSIERSIRRVGSRDYGCCWEDPGSQTLKVDRDLITRRHQKNARGMTLPEAAPFMTRTLLVRTGGLFMVRLLTHSRRHFVRAYPSGAERRAHHSIEQSCVQSQNERERNSSATRMPHFMSLYHGAVYTLLVRGVNESST